MVSMSARAMVTNEQVAQDLGLTHSTVSRIRSGERIPSLEIMLKIHEWGCWGLEKQALAKSLGEYAAGFESALVAHYQAAVTVQVRCDPCTGFQHGGCQGHRVPCDCTCGEASDGGRLG